MIKPAESRFAAGTIFFLLFPASDRRPGFTFRYGEHLSMRIAFAGTPDFAAAALKALIAAGHTITLVLTQPDRPSGRGMKLKPSPVKAVALEHGLTVLTPLALRGPKAGDEGEAALKALEESSSDVFVVAAYGLILPERALNAARGVGEDGSIKSINIHASLLPRWRGAAPINRAIEAMDKETGVDLMKMDIGLDTGDVICSAPVAITEEHDAARLTEELTQVGARLIVTALEHPETLTHRPQPEDGVTYAKKLLKTESPIDWTQDARQVAARIRAFSPFPGSTAVRNGETVKIWFAKAVEGAGNPGEILAVGDAVVIACGTGAVACTRLQRAGKPAMDAKPFAQSLQLKVGEVLA